jgi:hypothetical protein
MITGAVAGVKTMENHVSLYGAGAGFLAAFMSGSLSYFFMLVLVFGTGSWMQPPAGPPFPAWIANPALYLLIPGIANLFLGAGFGLAFSNGESTMERVSIGRGIKYSLVQPVIYLIMGMLLVHVLNPLHLAIWYITSLTLPVIFYSMSLVSIWNWHWQN